MLRALPLVSVLILAPAAASAQQPCTTTDARQVVNLIYSHLLERAADRGSDAHVQQLRRGDATVRDIVAAVAKSPEYDQQFLPGNNREAAVRNLYRHLLGREADAAGLQAHSQALVNQDKNAVIDTIVNSAEYQQKYGSNGVPGSRNVRYCRPERALGTTGSANERRAPDMDANGDGVITLSEWRGTRESFRDNDWNRDNILSGDEVREARRRQPSEEEGFGSQRQDALGAQSGSDFDDIDYNRDGRITEAEWVYGYDAFSRADRNRDGVITRREFNRSPAATTGR